MLPQSYRDPRAIIAIGLAILCLALPLEALLGYPDVAFRTIRHPGMWIGARIGALDRAANHASWSAPWRRVSGVAALAVLIAIPVAMAALAQYTLLALLPRFVALAPIRVAYSTFLAL